MRAGLLLLIVLPFVATAETAYVTDTLQLGLHVAADTSDRAFRTLESGQEMEIISRDLNYANVRLPDGLQGYVKVAFLVFRRPAKLIVSELQISYQSLQQELETTKDALSTSAPTIDSLQRQVAKKDAALDTNTTRIAELELEVDELRDQQAQYKYSLPFKWVGGAMTVCLLGGLLSGMWWIDYRSRKRHGGVRII